MKKFWLVVDFFFRALAVGCAFILLLMWCFSVIAQQAIPQDSLDLLTAGVLLALAKD